MIWLAGFAVIGLVAACVFFNLVRDLVRNWSTTALVAPTSNGLTVTDPKTGQPVVVNIPDWDGVERVTILVLGIDERKQETGPFRTDTMLILTIDPASKTAGLLSIPRDLWVQIPTMDTDGKINTAHFLGDAYDYPGGGPALAVETVKQELGIPVDYYVRFNFDSFEKVVDAIGAYVRGGGHWIEVGGYPFFTALKPARYLHYESSYPPLFADFFHIDAAGGSLSVYRIQPRTWKPWAGQQDHAAIRRDQLERLHYDLLEQELEVHLEADRTPELVRELFKDVPVFTAPAKYLIFKRWDALDEKDQPQVVVFFAPPDVLSGLFTLANFDEADLNGVYCPFCAGCGSIVKYPFIERESSRPRAVLGMFDVSARPFVPAATLSFALPMNKFTAMVGDMDESFLITKSWKAVRNM